MTVTPLWELDAPKSPEGMSNRPPDPGGFSGALERAVGAASDALARADAAERAFASGRGGLQEMTLERAQADVSLSLASAATSRVAQSLQTILGMQV